MKHFFKHIELFENYKLEESYVSNASVMQGLIRDILKISDSEVIAKMLFDFFQEWGIEIDRRGLGTPFGSLANAVYNTADKLARCRDFKEAIDEFGELFILANKMDSEKY